MRAVALLAVLSLAATVAAAPAPFPRPAKPAGYEGLGAEAKGRADAAALASAFRLARAGEHALALPLYEEVAGRSPVARTRAAARRGVEECEAAMGLRPGPGAGDL